MRARTPVVSDVLRLGARLMVVGAAATLAAGCVSNSPRTLGLDFGEVFAKDQQTFLVDGEKAALRVYPTGTYDIKLYGPQKVIDLGSSKQPMTVADVRRVSGATLIVLDAPEPGCAHVYQVYRVAGGESTHWENGYRSCNGPLAFSVTHGQWTARPTVKPAPGQAYMLVYQKGELYTRPLATASATRRTPAKAAAPKATAPADQAANLDDVAAPAADNAANLDDVVLPRAGAKVDTAGLKADQSSSVKMSDDKNP